MERVEVEVDTATARYLQSCARVRGSSVSEAAARQLHELALADSVARHATWAEGEPEFFADAEAERTAAMSA